MMMSEDIHEWTDGRYTLMFDEHTFFVFDNEREKEMTALQTTERLNEQQHIIEQLQEKNKQLMKIDLGEKMDYAKDDDEMEISRLCRVIAEDKGTIASLEEKVERLEDVIEKQNDLIETLWKLYAQER